MHSSSVNRRVALASLVLTVVGRTVSGLDLLAQETPTRIPHVTSCPQCSVVTEKVLTLGNPNDPVLLFSIANLERDRRGRYFAIGIDRAQIVVFDSTGKYLVALGRRGQGPGEFGGSINRLRVGPGDSLYVVDGSRHVSVFSPSLTFARRTALPAGPAAFFPLSNGTFAVSAPIRTPEAAGFPYHVLDSVGKVLRSFGPYSDVVPRARPMVARPFVLSNDERSIWVWSSAEYRFERWQMGGGYSGGVEVTNPPWRAKSERLTEKDTVINGRRIALRERAPHPVFTGVDATGLLWVHITIPIEKGQMCCTPNQPRPKLSYLVEIIDPGTNAVLLSHSTDAVRFLIPGTDLAYSAVGDEDGVVSFTVWRVTIRRP